MGLSLIQDWKMIARWDDLPYSSISYTFNIYLVGGFNPSEKYESQLGFIIPKNGKLKNVPNHQPVMNYK